MIDLHTFSKSLKVKWIKNLRDSTLANWKVIPKLYLDQFGKNLLIFDMNIDSFKSLPKSILKLSTFHKELINIWIEMRPLIDTTNQKHSMISDNKLYGVTNI